MLKTVLTVAVLGSMGTFAGFAMAQGKQGDAFGNDVSSLLAKLEAQCAHRRRTMPPDPRDDCAAKLRSDAQSGYGQDGASAGKSQASAAAPGATPGAAPGAAPGIGPGKGGGQAKGRR
jgi:hypothetical protein